MKNVKNYLMLLMFMMVGVLGLGFTSSAETYYNKDGKVKTLEKLDQPYVDEEGLTIAYKKLKIEGIVIQDTDKFGSGGGYRADDVRAHVKIGTITNEVYYVIWELIDANTGEMVKSAPVYVRDNNKYTWDIGVFEAMPKSFAGTYYIRMRFGTSGDKYGHGTVYSEWSDNYYFTTQPKLAKKKKGDVKRNSIKIRWQKMQGDVTYVVYARGGKYAQYTSKQKVKKKWYKIGTTKGSSFTIKKVKGAKLDIKKYDYDVKVIAQVKVNGKIIKSTVHNNGAKIKSY